MILSIDVGIKNLAVCLLRDNTIEVWKVLNLSYEKDACQGIIRAFQELDDRITTETIVLIERQMTKKMTNIQCYLEMFFRMKEHTSVIVYSPKHKLAGTNKENSGKGRALYTARKKASVEICKEWLDKNPQCEEITSLWNATKKKDDLADTLCQAISFLQNPPADVSQKVVNARKPTPKQEASGRYSKSNIKYLLSILPIQRTIEGGEAPPVLGKKLERAIQRFWRNVDECKKELFP